MAIQIINSGASLKIVNDSASRLQVKALINSIEVVKTNIIKLDVGKGINNIFLAFADVTVPATANPEALRDAINDMLSPAASNDSANLEAMKTSLLNIQTNTSNINDKIPYLPLLVDEGTPNVIYKGYAPIGSNVAAAVWAIEKMTSSGDITSITWAGGNKNFDKIWNNRGSLSYS